MNVIRRPSKKIPVFRTIIFTPSRSGCELGTWLQYAGNMVLVLVIICYISFVFFSHGRKVPMFCCGPMVG